MAVKRYERMIARMVVGLAFAVVFRAFGSNSFAEPSAPDLSEALTQAKLLAGLRGEERSAIEGAAGLRRDKPGEHLILQGKVMDRMFIILNGKAEVRINGKPVVVLSGQSLVGEIGFLDRLPASADVVLLE